MPDDDMNKIIAELKDSIRRSARGGEVTLLWYG